MTSMRILQLNIMILLNERKKFLYFLRSLVKGQDHTFFKGLTGVFCTVGGTLVAFEMGLTAGVTCRQGMLTSPNPTSDKCIFRDPCLPSP
jgi:hypothetical protein